MHTIKLISLFGMILFFSFSSVAQDIDEDFTNYYKEPVLHLDKYVDIQIKNIASRFDYCKFAFKLKNVSEDYIIYNNAKSKLVYEWGEARLKKTKTYFLKPKQTTNEVFDVSGDTRFIQDNTNLIIAGLVRVPAKGKTIPLNDHIIASNEIIIDSDEISIQIKKVDIRAKKSSITITVINKGENYLILNPSSLSIDVAADINMPNDALIMKSSLLAPGKKENVSLAFDLNENSAYFNYPDKRIIFGDFLEISKPINLPPIQLTFEIDRQITYKMNK